MTTSVSPITITRALVELKTLNSRIEKTQQSAIFITYKIRDEQKGEVTPDKLQKINDLIDYRNRLKRAIVQSNATTMVKIHGEEYTVAEAIERKTSIDLEKNLLAEMRKQYATATRSVETHNQRVDQGLEKLLQTEFAKGNVKSDVNNIKTISDAYLQNNRAELIDPLKLAATMERIEEAIMNFEQEVDLVLSESNAVTLIQVSQAKKRPAQ